MGTDFAGAVSTLVAVAWFAAIRGTTKSTSLPRVTALAEWNTTYRALVLTRSTQAGESVGSATCEAGPSGPGPRRRLTACTSAPQQVNRLTRCDALRPGTPVTSRRMPVQAWGSRRIEAGTDSYHPSSGVWFGPKYLNQNFGVGHAKNCVGSVTYGHADRVRRRLRGSLRNLAGRQVHPGSDSVLL
jgi:hypothetical protein